MNIGIALSGSSHTWQLTSLYEDAPTGTVWRARDSEGSQEPVLVAAPAYGAGAQGQERFPAHALAWRKLAELQLPGMAVALHDWGVQPQPFLVVDAPVGTPLQDLAVADSPLPEREALACAGRLASLLQALHDELDCALAPSALEQARWDRTAELLWLPLWHELVHAPAPERRAFDLAQVGALLHGLLLSRPALHLWGQPVLLDEQQPADGPASRGAWRLLRWLLHPNPAQRLASAAALATEIEHLLHAWDGEPSELLDQAEGLFQEAEAGALEPARQADALLAILARRTPDLPDLDWMQADVAALIAHQQTIETALQLARGRSLTPAVEKLRRAAAGSGDSLALARWAAVLATPDIDQVLIDDGASQRLRAAVEALQGGDLAAAQAALAALPQAPPSLSAEVTVRLAWLDAASHANDPAAALAALDQASAALDAIADAELRTALDAALGGLARWRQAAAAYQATAAEAARSDEHVGHIRSLRQYQRWLDACSELRIAAGMDPADRALAEEARLLGMEALLAGHPELAVDAFALAAADLAERRLAQTGWRVARALAAMQTDPLSEASLAQAQLAVARCRTLTADEPAASPPLQQLVQALKSGIEAAQATAWRVGDVHGRRAAQALAGELDRLTRPDDPSTPAQAFMEAIANVSQRQDEILRQAAPSNETQPDPLLVLERAIERAWAADASAAHALLAQRLGPAPAPALATAERPLPAPPTPAQIDHMMQSLISPHFDEVAAALEELAQGALGKAGAAKLAPLVKEAERAIAQHKGAMAEAARLAAVGEHAQAQRVLHDATRNLRSRTCWDPTLSDWISVGQWQARLEPLLSALESNDPRRWLVVLDTPASGRSAWSKSVRDLARQRTVEIAAHRREMDAVVKDADRDRAAAHERFQNWRREHRQWVCCWDPRRGDWVEMQAFELELAKAVDTNRTPVYLRKHLDEAHRSPSQSLPKNGPKAVQADTFQALLERHLSESKTLTELRQHVRGLLPTNSRYGDILTAQYGSLMVWEQVDRWIASVEQRHRGKTIDQTTKSFAVRTLKDLDDLQTLSCWRPYVHIEGPTVFSITRSRLQAIAQPQSAGTGYEVPASLAPGGEPDVIAATKTVAPSPNGHPPDSLRALLERPLCESSSLTDLRRRLHGLLQEDTVHAALIKHQYDSLLVWELEEVVLAGAENLRNYGNVDARAKAHAAQAIEHLDALTRVDYWRPYIPTDQPTVFDTVRGRLQAIAALPRIRQ